MATATRRAMDELTPRQRDVIRMIAAGRTNGEIATALGVTIDGAKWHVSEILSKLGVTTREEAAEVWRREQAFGPRLRRGLAGAIPSLGWRPLAFGGVALAVAAGVAVAVGLAVGGRDEGSPASLARTVRPTGALQEVVLTATPSLASSPAAGPAVSPTVRPTSTLIPGWDFLDSRDGTMIVLKPARGPCGSAFQADLTGFGPGEDVSLLLARGFDNGIEVAVATTDGDGTATIEATIPTDDCVSGNRFLYAAYRSNRSAGGPKAIFQVDQVGQFEASLVESDCTRVRIWATGLPAGVQLELLIGEADPLAHVFAEAGTLTIDEEGRGEIVIRPGSVCDWGEPAAVYAQDRTGSVRAVWRAIIEGTP